MSDKIKVIKLSTAWCGPCKAMKPVWEQLIKENTNSQVEYISYDVEEDEEKSEPYNVKSVPTIVFLKNDVEIHRWIGSKSKNDILNKIEEIR